MTKTKLIAFMNRKGGVLKTSLATNIAYVLASKKKKVLFIDTDSQNNASERFGLNPFKLSDDFYGVLKGSEASKVAQQISYRDKKLSLWFIPAPFVSISKEIANGNISDQQITKAFGKLLKFAEVNEFDYVIFDTPPGIEEINQKVVRFVDDIIIPSKMEKDSYTGVALLYKELTTINQQHKIKAVVPTLTNLRTKIHSQVLESFFLPLESSHGILISKHDIPISAKAPEYNLTNNFVISGHPKTNPLKRKYFAIAKELKYCN